MTTSPRRETGGSSAFSPAKPSSPKTWTCRRCAASRLSCRTRISVGCASKQRSRSCGRISCSASQGEPGYQRGSRPVG